MLEELSPAQLPLINDSIKSSNAHTKLSTVAEFPEGTFPENLAVRSDNSMLMTSLKARQLWYVPAAKAGEHVAPALLFTFDKSPLSLIEPEPDVFYLCTSDGYKTHAASLYRIDLRGWVPGQEIHPELVLTFPSAVRALNGSCLIGPKTILIADSIASLIWRVDLSRDGRSGAASVWLKHYSMLYHPGEMKPEQPGVNGLQFAKRISYLYYTSTALKLFMRVRVDRETLAPLGIPEYLGGGKMMDDFCMDEDRGFAYVATHRDNTIERMPLAPDASEAMVSVAGEPFDQELVGPSSGAWGRAPGEHGKTAFFTTDGGTTAPPADGVLRTAKILRVELIPETDRYMAASTPLSNSNRNQAMAYECRRVVTGHTREGKSAVLFDSSLPLLDQDSDGAGSRQEDRAGAASRVLWTTQGLPADNDDSSDAGLRKVHTAESDGTVLRIVQYSPGVTPRHHRTNSIDYAVILVGSIELELDNETVKLDTGDILVQRGTIHNWINSGTKPCIIAYILIGAHPVTINGVTLPADG